jgi:hypothetical protein
MKRFYLIAGVLFAILCVGLPSAQEDGRSEQAAEDSNNGILKISIFDAEGRPTPAMVAISQAKTGEPYFYGKNPFLPPKKAQSKKTEDYSRRLQWKGKAPQDIDGQITLEIPAGDYEIHVGKGIEYAPVAKPVTVAPAAESAVDFHLKRFVDMPEKGWWSGDDHFHCERKSKAANDAIFVSAAAEDITVVNCLLMGSLTSHGNYAQYAFGEAGRAVRDGQAIIPGQEDPRTDVNGHVIVMNIQEQIRDEERYFQYDRVLRQARQDPGAVSGYAHAKGYEYDSGGTLVDFEDQAIDLGDPIQERSWALQNSDLGLSMDIIDGLVDFMELLDAHTELRTQLYYDFLNMGFRVAASAGSDFPWSPHLGDQRVYVYTGEGEPFSADAWFENHKAGHTFVTQGTLVEFTVDGQIPGSVLQREAGQSVIVKATAFGHPQIGSPKKANLVRFGKTIDSVESSDPEQMELAGEWTVPIERSCWLALHVEAHNGSDALTTPVYIEVDGEPTLDPTQLRKAVELRLFRFAMQRHSISRMIKAFKEQGSTENGIGKKARLIDEYFGAQWMKDQEAYLARQEKAEAYYKDLLKYAKP